MEKKYILIDESIECFGHTLYRIRALRDFGAVKAGNLGGFIQTESNLSHDGNCWVYGNAWVSGNAQVYGDASVSGNAKVYGNAWVSGNALINFNIKKNADFVIFGFFGDANRSITISTKQDIINCGCFSGTLEQFKQAVDLKYKGEGNYYTAIKMIEAVWKK